MTACAACETTQGPFSRKAGVGPLCRPATAEERRLVHGDKANEKPDPRIVACNKRRAALDDQRYGKDPQ